MLKSLTFALSALALLAVIPAHASEDNFWFTDSSHDEVVIKFADGEQLVLSEVNGPTPESCRGENAISLRDQELESRYIGVDIQDYSAIRDVLTDSSRQGSQWVDANVIKCGPHTAVACLRSVGGSACAVVRRQQG